MIRLARLLPVLALLAACNMGPKKPVYLNRDVAKVVVLPPFFEVVQEGSWQIMWPYLIDTVAGRGYQVVPADAVKAFYEKNNFRGDPGEIKTYTAK